MKLKLNKKIMRPSLKNEKEESFEKPTNKAFPKIKENVPLGQQYKSIINSEPILLDEDNNDHFFELMSEITFKPKKRPNMKLVENGGLFLNVV